MNFLPCFFSLVLVLRASADANDVLVVAVNKRLEIISTLKPETEEHVSLGSYNASMLVGLSYDSAAKKLFFSDKHSPHVNIFSVNLDRQRLESNPQEDVHSIIEQGSTESVESLAFDYLEQTILWVDATDQSIRRTNVNKIDGREKGVELVHNLKGDKPRGLTLDPCHRRMFWTNWNRKQPSIESSLMNGSERKTIVSDSLLMPHGLALDMKQQKVYWANNLHVGSFRIERSNFDGSDRELVFSGNGQFVFSLTANDRYLYWTDWEQNSLWALAKDTAGSKPKAIRHFDSHRPMAVVILEDKPFDCSVLNNNSIDNSTHVPSSPYESEVSLCSGYCYNEGQCIETNGELMCRCTDHFIGDRCEGKVTVPPITTAANTPLIPSTTALSLEDESRELVVAVGKRLEIISTVNLETEKHISLGSYNASMLVGLSYDSAAQKLFFSDKHSPRVNIFSVGLDRQRLESNPQEDVHCIIEQGSGESVEGLAFDHLEKSVLWIDTFNESIKRANVNMVSADDGGKKVEQVHILKGEKPRGLTIDPCHRRMFWTNWSKKQPTIESSLMNGSERKIIASDNLLMPHGLALDMKQQKIYWANNLHFGSFRIERSNFDGSDRELVFSGRGQFVFSLTVSDRYLYWTDWEQNSLWALAKEATGAQPRAIRHFSHKPMAVIIIEDEPVDCSLLPSNSLNYSTHVTNQPYESEVSLCSGYCYNDGQCIETDGELVCRCTDHYKGDRCEELVIAAVPSTGATCLPLMSSSTPSFRFEDQSLFNALVGVSVLCLFLFFVVICLSFRVHRMSQRPRLRRRRFVGGVKKSSPPETDTSGVVLDIENCCNMNICETPCVEPPNRTPSSERSCGGAGKGRSSKSSDKQHLLRDF